MRNKKGVAQLFMIIGVLAGLVTILSFVGLLDTASIFDTGSITGSYSSVYKAWFGNICCEEGSYNEPYVRYTDDQSLYKCNSYTDECRIKVHPDRDLSFLGGGRSVYYQICDVNGYNCGSKIILSWSATQAKLDNVKEVNINYGRSIKFSPVPLNERDMGYLVYDADYRRFYIKGQENGKVFVQSSCILNSDLKTRVLSDGLNELSKDPLSSNNCQNYVTDFVLVDTRTYQYNGKEVLCQARQLYTIDTERFKDGSTRKIQGNKIKSVECCPQEANCGSNFEFVEVNVRECTYNTECANSGDPVAITGTSYVTFGCDDGTCKQSTPVDVECTNNNICVSKFNKPNMVCKNFKCEDDVSWLGHCGDDVCEDVIGETPSSCPQDCGKYESPTPNYLIYIIIIVLFVLVIVFRNQIRAILNAILGRIGVRI